MSNPQETIVVSLTPEDLQNKEKMKEVNEFFGDLQDVTNGYCLKLAEELNVSDACARDVFYLRSRSRWSQKLENKLISLHRSGNPPNIFEFGN